MKKGKAETVVTADQPMGRKQYEKALRALQIELCTLQDWVKNRVRGWSWSSRAAMPPARAA